MDYPIETGREPNGSWVATMPRFPGWVVYGQSREEALVTARKLFAILLHDGMRPDGRILAFHPGRIQTPLGRNFRFRPLACALYDPPALDTTKWPAGSAAS